MSKKTFFVDNITWNDLSLEDIYSRLNSCITSAGEDRLLERLRNPYIEKCQDYLDNVGLIDEIKDIEASNLGICLNKMLLNISKLNNYKFLDEINSFKDEENKSNLKHFIIGVLVLITFCLIFVFPGPGIVAFFIMIGYSVSDYFKTKNIIASKLTVFNYLIRIINSIKKARLEANVKYVVYSKNLERLYKLVDIFEPFTKGTFVISEGARVTSNPLSILFDYVRMIFHVDIIKYNSMIVFIKEHIFEAIEIYEIIGDVDQALAINKFKGNIPNLCKPDFANDNRLNIVDSYHIQLKDPVCNSINTDKSILITGCNASGKSTFLKTIAIDVIFAQSFGFVFAKSYSAPFYKVFSSMALKDDINEGESYFVSEIKSLKRVLDDTKTTCEGVFTLCVIDEVLRGTNTVERIAASVEILKSLTNKNVLCFAATHDIELTELLSKEFDNYHFTEDVSESDVTFNYKIFKGPANSKNAIRLLSVLGYDETVVKNASERADVFLNFGVWS